MIITDLIKEEIRCWSKEVLEVPSENFEQLPPCPYAKQAWKKDKVKIHVTDDLSLATRIKKNNPPVDDKVEVIAWTDWNDMSADEFDKWVDDKGALLNFTESNTTAIMANNVEDVTVRAEFVPIQYDIVLNATTDV